MKQVKVAYADKKTCFVLMKTLSSKHGIEPGTIFSLKIKDRYFHSIKGEIEKSIYAKKYETSFIPITVGECILFIDVVFDPWARTHYFRFLSNSKFLVIPFKKGKTIKFLKTIFDIKSNTVFRSNDPQ